MRLSKKMVLTLAALLFMLTTTLAVAQSKPGQLDFDSGFVYVTGEGLGKSDYKDNPGKLRLTAFQAARMNAQAKLVEFLKLEVEASARSANTEFESSEIKVKAQGVISNAVEVGEPVYNPEEGSAKVVMAMPLFGGRGSVAEVAFLPFKTEPKVSFPQPVNESAVNDHYTGLIIDCSGMKVDRVMSPVIKNANGQEIYGHKNLEYDKIIMQGMAGYANSVNDQVSQSRAGSNPLVVKAERVEDLNANPVVSVADADKILTANKHDGFLNKCAVVFVHAQLPSPMSGGLR